MVTMTEIGDDGITLAGQYDVIVAGGGLGGVAAALAAARAGAKTLLVERNSFVGGVATAGMCCSIFNCYYTADHQLGVHGIAVEVADRMAQAMGYGKKWHKHKGHVIYDLELGKLVLQELLDESGVDLLLNTLIADAVIENNSLKGLVIESKSGRQALLGSVVVDATGDADVAYLAGAPVHSPKPGQGIHSLCFRLGNVDMDSFIDYFRANPEQYPEMMDVAWTGQEALAQYDDCGTFLFPHGGGMQMKAFQQAAEHGDLPQHIGMHDTTNACQMHGMKQTGIVHIITGFVHFDGLDISKITHSINDGRKMAYCLAKVYSKYLPGFEKCFVAGVAANLGVRTSRWLDGDFVYRPEMCCPGVRFDDAIGRIVPVQNKVVHQGKNAWGAQIMEADTADIPLRCLLPRSVEGLIMGAGRSVSVTEPGMLRVMVHTMVIGQGAGVAAAIAANDNSTVKNVNVSKLQAELERQGVKLK